MSCVKEKKPNNPYFHSFCPCNLYRVFLPSALADNPPFGGNTKAEEAPVSWDFLRLGSGKMYRTG